MAVLGVGGASYERGTPVHGGRAGSSPGLFLMLLALLVQGHIAHEKLLPPRTLR